MQISLFGKIAPCLFLIIHIYIRSCNSFNCIHDSLVVQETPATSYRHHKHNYFKEKREMERLSFEPLLIHWYLEDGDPGFSENMIFNIRMSLLKIRKFLSETLQVRKVQRPFLLDRRCTKIWTFGRNKKQCSKRNLGPEVCKVNDVEYVIPSMFLKGIQVYDFSDDIPRFTIDSGEGIPDANFVLFIVSRRSALCNRNDVQAYGLHCKLDKHDRPTAGLINICPEYFFRRIYKAKHYYNVILHEIFHILGFSHSLFSKFSPCSGAFCDVPKNIVHQGTDGINRLVFPLVAQNMQNHLNCSKQYFGAPMDSKPETNATTEITYSSHWHPLLMYSSIMVPFFDAEDIVVVDMITLALLDSTGWYKVNYSNSDSFVFGKGGGCDFGLTNSSCEENEDLCLLGDNSTDNIGCDLFHTSIGKCESVEPGFNCGIYKHNSGNSCIEEGRSLFELEYRPFDFEPRCFMYQIGDDKPQPACLLVKCITRKVYDVLINSTWVSCQFKNVVKEGNITVYCSQKLPYCSLKEQPVSPTACSLEDSFVISVRMYLEKPNFEDVIAKNNFKNLKVSSVRAIASALHIPVNAITNASLSSFKKTYIDFSLCPLIIAQGKNLSDLVERIQSFLDEGTFTNILPGRDDIVVSSTNVQINPEDTTVFSDYEGFHALRSVPVVFGLFLVATCLASAIRLYLIQRHKPNRALETEKHMPSTVDSQSPQQNTTNL